MTDMLEFLLDNPIFLAPLLFVGATLVYAVLKKLIKVALIAAIAGALYVLLVEYVGAGI